MKTFKRLVSFILVFSMIASMFLTVTADTGTERTGISIDRVTTQNKLGENATYPEGYYVTDKRLDKAPVTFEFWAYVPSNVWSTASGVVLSTYAEIGASTNTNDWFTLSIEPEGRPKLSIGYSDGRCYEKLFGNWLGADMWTHVSIVLNDETNKVLLYVNGVYKGEADFGAGDSAPILNQNLDTLLYLLSDAHVANGKAMCDIKISDVAVYSDMRTATEVSSNYVNGVNAGDDDLMLYYQLSEDDKEKDIVDASGNGYDMKYNRTFITEAEMDAIRAQEDKDYAYSIVLLPDTHFYTTTATQKRKAILDYVIANRNSKNIQYVIGLGDMSGDGKAGEWELVKEEYGRLDAAGIPYSVVRGNHDSVSNPAIFNSIFGQGTAYYEHVSKNGGFYKTNSSTNTYVCFKANNNVDYMILNLDFGIDRDVLKWVDKVLSEHPNHRVIVSTHAWLSGDGRMLTEGSFGEPSMYNPAYLDPDYIWDKCLSKHANIDMIVCGHTQSDQILTTPIVGVNGNVVYQVLINNQNSPWQLSGLGNIAIMNFTADGRFANIAYYATVHGKYFYEGNADIKFDFDAKDAVPERTGVEFEEVKTSGVSHPDGYYKSEDKLSALPVTYEAWVNVKDFDAFKTGGSILGNREKGKNSYFALELLPFGQISLKYVNEGTQKTYTFPVEPDSSRPTVNPVRIWNDGWHHLAVTHDVANNKIKCYIDGVFASEMSADGFALPAFSNMSSTLYIGSDGEDGHSKFGTSGSFTGIISDAALYCDVRTDAEIKSDFDNGVSAGDADLLAAYDISSFDQNRNIEDISGSGVDLKWYSSNIVMDGTKESYSTVKGLDSIPQTYEMWIYLPAVLLSDLKSDVIFGNCNAANNNGIRIDIKENANGEIRLSYLGDWAQAVSWGAGATIPADTWTHVAITHDIATSTVKFYFNGVLGATRTITDGAGVNFIPDASKVLANTTFYLGADGHDPSSKTEPRVLGDFAAYSDVRSADEIAASYKNGIDVNDANLMLYWDIPETGKGQDIEDKSNNNVDLDYNSLLVLDRSKESYSTSKGFDVVPQTYEMWAYLPAESNQALNNIIFSNVSLQNPNGIRIDFQEGKNGYVRLAYLNDWTGATAWETGATVPVNTWVHVTIVHDLTAQKVYFYFNGELKATRENVAAPDAAKVLANTEFYFGGDARDPAHSAPPRVLGDFAVYSDVRTAAEVMSDYKNGPDVNDANIMLYWDVPESNEKQDIEDKTGNGYDLKYSLVETPETEDKTYLLQDITDSLKLHGRTSVTSDGIVCDHSATGIEFSAYIEGEVKLSVSVFTPLSGAQPDTYFTVYVDGVRQETRFNVKEGTVELVIANFEEGGVHTIRVLKQTESANSLSIMRSISFNGYLEDAPAEKDLFIEFLGDSITSGYGNLCANGTANAGNGLNQDATLTYAYLTAEKLGADHSLVSCSGIGVAGSWCGNFVMKDFFTAQSYLRDPSVKYEKTFTPDIVVINLGTNDSTKVPDGFRFKEAAKELIALVRSTYGEDVKIVWAANMMGACMETYSQAAINELGGASAGLYFCSLTADWSGGGAHPSKEAHAVAATDLANFIRERVLPEIPDSYETCVDGEGNPLNPYFVNGDIWVEENGKLKMPTGIVNSFLLFDNELATNRIEATFHMNLCWSNSNRTGLAFALTDHDGDHSFGEGGADVSYYRAFICGQNRLGLVEMGKYQDWTWLANEVELEPLGIDVSEGVTIAAEWDAEGNIRVYANGILAIEVKDETPLTGNLYGMVIREWCNTTGSYTDYVSSFKAVGAVPIPDKKVEITVDPIEGGAVTGAGSYEKGTNVTLTVTANTGYTFVGWYIGETLVSTYKTYTFAVTEDVDFTAKFEKAEYTVPVDAQGNKLNPYFVNGNTWTEENGTMKPAPGAMENFILFDNPLNANRIEATFKNLPLNNDNNTRHGIVFALTDIDGDNTFNMDDDGVSYYFLCVSGYGQIQLIRMGAGKSWSVYITGGNVDVASDVTLAVEWDAQGNVKVFANGNLVIDQNVGESLTGNLYGVLMRSWANTEDGGFAHKALLSSFVAGKESTVTPPPTNPDSYENCTDGEGNLLDPYFVNGVIWVEENGSIKMPAGPERSFLLFNNELNTNRIEATIFPYDLHGSDDDRNGIVFALTDIDGDHTFDFDSSDVSYYWAFITGWGSVEVVEMGAHQNWSWLSSRPGPTLVDPAQGVTLAAEWDDAGHIRIYVNGILVHDIFDATPLTGNLYGLLVRKWGNAQGPDCEFPYDAPVTSFIAGTPAYENCTDANGNVLDPYFVNGVIWTLEDGKLKMPEGYENSFLLFDNELANNRIEATLVIKDTGIWNDINRRNGIVFALTDHAGDGLFAYADTDISYYWAFVDDWNCLHLFEMSSAQQWYDLTPCVDLHALGIDVAEGVTLAAEWDAQGHIKVFANGKLALDVTDSTPLTGKYYGLLVNNYGNFDNAYGPYNSYSTSFVAGGALETPMNVTVTVDPVEGGTTAGAGNYYLGQNVTLTATANAGYSFVGWYVGEELKSAAATYTFTVDGDITVTAKFEKLQDAVEVTVTDTDINYTVNGNVVTVDYALACKVGYLSGDKYVAIAATANGDGTYSFTVPEGVSSVVVVVNGDVNGDGTVNAGDYGRLNALLQGKITLTAEQDFAANTNGDTTVNAGDYGRLNAVLQGKTDLTW